MNGSPLMVKSKELALDVKKCGYILESMNTELGLSVEFFDEYVSTFQKQSIRLCVIRRIIY